MMPPDSELLLKRVRQLSRALILSGALNIGILSLWLYWTIRERPPTSYYCELKPASEMQQQMPLADSRGCAELLTQLSALSFPQLVEKLNSKQLIENGYREQDLALACLATFYYLDVPRALSKQDQAQQKRAFAWKVKPEEPPRLLTIYPNLSQQQFESLIHFIHTERWPFTAEKLFALLQKQKKEGQTVPHLVETFTLTPEFWTVELLFNRAEQAISKQELLELLLEGKWQTLAQFVEQQKQVNDLSSARRQKFLIDYLNEGARLAALLLLRTEWDLAVKKLEDQQVLAILRLTPLTSIESERFAKEMLRSPRGLAVWQQAASVLYQKAGEEQPKEWNHQAVLARFVPEKTINIAPKLVGKQQAYVVQEGDSLWKIAKRFGVDVHALQENNRLESATLKPGTVLKIP